MKTTLFTLFLVAASALSNFAADTKRPTDIVVLLSIDGLAGFYLDDPQADLTNLRRLAKAGASSGSMKASTPTVTWPNHTTLVTGDHPGRHGVVANSYLDRTTDKKVALIGDPKYDKDEIVKVPTIYDAAKQAGLTTASIRWPATRNAKSLDFTMPDCRDKEMSAKYSTPGLADQYQAMKEKIQESDEADTIGKDDVITALFCRLIREKRPQLALLHLANVDHTQHAKGPRTPAAYAAIAAADKQIGVIWDELQRDFPGRATLIVVSDHGFSETTGFVSASAALREAGIMPKDPHAPTPVSLIAAGGASLIYILDEKNRDELAKKIEATLTKVDGISKVVPPSGMAALGMADPKVDPHSPDMIAFVRLGLAFGDTSSGLIPNKDKPEKKGTHGHDATLPDLHATFVAAGAGIAPGTKLGDIENITVAPTIAELLKIPFPNTDGKPLAKALAR